MWALVLEGLRGRGWVWWLAELWVVIGAGGAIYATVAVNHPGYEASDFRWMLQWQGEIGLIIGIGVIAEVIWVLLSVPLLVAGFFWLRGWQPRNWLRAAAWASSWVVGLVLMNQAANWAVAGENGTGSAMTTRELAMCAGWLALGAVMTWILVRPQTQADRSIDSNTATR